MDNTYAKEQEAKQLREWEESRKKVKKVPQICFNCKSFEGYTVSFKCNHKGIVIPYGIPTLRCDNWEEKC